MSEAQAKPNQVGPSGKHVASNVRRLRTTLGWSTYEVSAMLKDAGRPIAASSITNIEAGRRRVDADDLVALAVVFGVNPSALLLPVDESGSIELTGGGTVAGATVWEWADGERPLRLADDAAIATEQWARFLRLSRPQSRRRRGFDRMQSEVSAVKSHLHRADEIGRVADQFADEAEHAGDPQAVELATKALRTANEYSYAAVRTWETALRDLGLTHEQIVALAAALREIEEDRNPRGAEGGD